MTLLYHNLCYAMYCPWIAIELSCANVQLVCLAFKDGKLYICQQSIL
jgi:hypothetical protein